MSKLDREARSKILHLLCEGSSIRAVARLTGASENTVTKLLVDAGKAASAYQDETLRNLPCRRIQVDEIWSFCYAKQGNLPENKQGAARLRRSLDLAGHLCRNQACAFLVCGTP